jgi:large subunit ribosomal protein L10e
MTRLRPARAYRDLKRPFTRKSKYRNRDYVGGVPGSKISLFDMGEKGMQFSHRVTLYSKNDILIRHNALEAARVTANKYLGKKMGKKAYHFKILIYPHHVMRENPLATGAGADRFSTGMKKSYGKSIGRAARVKNGQRLLWINIAEDKVPFAMEALRKAGHKLPCQCTLETTTLEVKEKN